MVFEELVREVVAEELGVALDKVAPKALLSVLSSDYLDGLALILALKNKFDIEISNEEADELATVQDVFNLVEAKL